MIRFSLRLLGRSMRWVAPAVAYLLGLGLVIANPGPLRANAVVLFPLHEVVVCWLAVVLGNVDDDGHRELCTAVAGSPSRLVVWRTGAALVLAVAIAALSLVAIAGFSVPRSFVVVDLLAAGSVLLAGGLVGLAVGAVVHRPIVRHPGVTLLVSAAVLVAAFVFPPVIDALRSVEEGADGGAVVLVGSAAVVAGLATAIGTRVVVPRSRG